MRMLLVVLVLAGCGSVEAAKEDANGGAGGAGGGAGVVMAAAGAAGSLSGDAGSPGGTAGSSGRGGAAGEDHSGPGGAAGAVPSCDFDTNTAGFAFNGGCNGEPTNSKTACRAACELNGQHYVGCVANSPYTNYCYASCADCPPR